MKKGIKSRIVYPAASFQPPDTCPECLAGIPFDKSGNHVEGNRTELALLAEQLCQQLRTVHASDEYRAVWRTAQLHRGQYTGPTYTKQLESLERAIQKAKSSRSK